MSLGKPLVIVLIFLISSCSGCMFLRHTEFSLLSFSVDDDEGFPRMHLCFNNSDTITLSLTDPHHARIFSDTFYYGLHDETIYLSDYRTIPSAGTYVLEAVDASKNTIYENELSFKGTALSFTSIDEDWWVEEANPSIVAFRLGVKNTGDLPAYPATLTIAHGTTMVSAQVLPTVVLPFQTKELTCFLHVTGLSLEQSVLTISLVDTDNNVLVRTTHAITPKDPISSWSYHWNFQGSRSLALPDVDWFYEYYKGVERFDIEDYAAYVFNHYDDLFIRYVADQLLLLSNTGQQAQQVEFIGSFVQGLEYTKDDPSNESYEYPRYPLETLKDQHGDCEDKAILTAALLSSLGYNVSLIRLPNHMAVGVHLNQTLPVYTYYVDQYYFLETTTLHMPLGKIPSEYQGLSNVTVYPVSSRPLLFHSWKNATRFTLSTGGDYVSLKILIENVGANGAPAVEVHGAFYDSLNRSYEQKTTTVYSLVAGEKRLVELTVTVPSLMSTTLKTQLYLDAFMVHERESSSRFSG